MRTNKQIKNIRFQRNRSLSNPVMDFNLKLEPFFFRNISFRQQQAKLRINNIRVEMKVKISKVLDFRTADIISQVKRNLETVFDRKTRQYLFQGHLCGKVMPSYP